MRFPLTLISEKFSPELRKIISNISWLFTDRILRMGVGLIVGAWVARYLKPEQFGLYNYALAFVSLFGVIASLGLEQIVVRNLVHEPSAKDEILGTTFVLKLTAGILVSLSAIGAIIRLRPQDNLMHWLVGITAAGLVIQAFDTLEYWFQFKVESKYRVIARNTAFTIVALVKVLLIEIKAPLIAFAWAGFAELALGAIGLVIVYQLSGQTFLSWRGNFNQAKTLMKDSWPLIFASLSIMLYIGIDKIMLGQLATPESVGIYSVATRISELWIFIPSAVVVSVNPSIVEAQKTSQHQYYNKLQKTLNILVILAYFIAISLGFLSTPIIVLLFGNSYASAGGVLAIHIWGQVFSFIGLVKGIWLVTEGLTIEALVITSFGAVTNILLNILLIPTYRETGAAIATVISYGLVDYVIFLIYPPFRKLGKLMTNALLLKNIGTTVRSFWNR